MFENFIKDGSVRKISPDNRFSGVKRTYEVSIGLE